jgi:hypothetical protein
MAFLTETDYAAIINPDDLEVVQASNDNNRLAMEQVAMEYIRGYTRSRYDMDYEFALEASERNPKLVQVMIDEVLYHLHATRQGRNFPEHRLLRKEQNDEWLDKVQRGRINPGFKVLDDEDGVSDPGVPFRLGSNTKNSSVW